MIAHENGKVLGFSHFDNERFGPIGVAADQRGRGIGQVLMYQTLRAQRLAGFQNRVVSLVGRQDRGADLQRGGVQRGSAVRADEEGIVTRARRPRAEARSPKMR